MYGWEVLAALLLVVAVGFVSPTLPPRNDSFTSRPAVLAVHSVVPPASDTAQVRPPHQELQGMGQFLQYLFVYVSSGKPVGPR